MKSVGVAAGPESKPSEPETGSADVGNGRETTPRGGIFVSVNPATENINMGCEGVFRFKNTTRKNQG